MRAISVLYDIWMTHFCSHDSMTLGHVYDLDLKKNEALIKDVIIQAQGEVCEAGFCERFLTAIRWLWRNTSSK